MSGHTIYQAPPSSRARYLLPLRKLIPGIYLNKQPVLPAGHTEQVPTLLRAQCASLVYLAIPGAHTTTHPYSLEVLQRREEDGGRHLLKPRERAAPTPAAVSERAPPISDREAGLGEARRVPVSGRRRG